MEDIEDGLDVERGEGSGRRQGRLLVTDIQSAIVKPDVGLNRDTTDRQGREEGDVTPVVVV